MFPINKETKVERKVSCNTKKRYKDENDLYNHIILLLFYLRCTFFFISVEGI